MKKGLIRYITAWVIVLMVFQAICFLFPGEAAGMSKYGGAFWAGYGFIMLAFVGQLVCTCLALREASAEKRFYKLPLITLSYSGLIMMLIVGGIVMAVPGLPNWIGALICLMILVFYVIAILKAVSAAELVEKMDVNVKNSTAAMRSLAAEAENLVSLSTNPEIRRACKNVYEAVRYSDPVSNEETVEIETRIREKVKELKRAAENQESTETVELSEECRRLIEERNRICKNTKERK